MKPAVLFEGSFREGTIVNKENALTVGTLLVAFIFQKTVTVEYPGGSDRTKKLYNKQWPSVNNKNGFAADKSSSVIPAQAGIQAFQAIPGPRFHGDDE